MPRKSGMEIKCSAPQILEAKITGVYLIQCRATGKVYIGSAARCMRIRWRLHYNSLKRGEHENTYLQRAWNKYGEQSFEFSILEECKPELCVVREQYWIDYYKSANRKYGYNLAPNAGSMLGFRFSSEGLENAKRAGEARAASPEFQEALKRRNADPMYRVNLTEGIKRRDSDPNYKKKLIRAARLREMNGYYKTMKRIKALRQHQQKRKK